MVTKLTDDNRVNVFIVDETVYERKRSKKVELLAKVYDHAKDIHTYGFRLLTLGWSDGNFQNEQEAQRQVKISSLKCDEKALGELYCLIAQELSDVTWSEALKMIMGILRSTLTDKSFLTEEEVAALLDAFIGALPKMFKSRLLKCA
jgi:hypothetical protein